VWLKFTHSEVKPHFLCDRYQGATVGMFSPSEGGPDIQSSRDHDAVGRASDHWAPEAARCGLLSR
jgi:hypothetical protein